MFEHRYIRKFNTQQDYQDALDSHQFQEVNVAAVTDDRNDTPDTYQYSHRTTNGDDQILGHYNSSDPVNYFAGLEIIWGYWGWQWQDYTLDGQTLKGGKFINVKSTNRYPDIFDGYRLQHINDLTTEVAASSSRNSPFMVGYFQNDNILSANNAFNRQYVYIDPRNNTWNVRSCVNMFYSDSQLSSQGVTDLYFTQPNMTSGPVFSWSYNGYVTLHFNSIEVYNIGAASNVGQPWYLGRQPTAGSRYENYNQIVNSSALETCYDYSRFRCYGALYVDINYTGQNMVVLPGFTSYNIYIRCHKPWTISSRCLSNSETTRLEIDIDEETIYNYAGGNDTKSPKALIGKGNVYVKQLDSQQDLDFPRYMFRKYPLNLFFKCNIYNAPLEYNAYRDGLDIPTAQFNEFLDCVFYGLSYENPLVITGLWNYNSVLLSLSANGFDNTVMPIEIHLSESAETQRQYSEVSMSKMYIIKDSSIKITKSVSCGCKWINSKIELAPGNTYYINNYGMVPDYEPVVYSNSTVSIGYVRLSKSCKNLRLKGVKANNTLNLDYKGYENLVIFDAPVSYREGSVWNLEDSKNLNIQSLIDSVQRQVDIGFKVNLTINRVLYNRLTDDQKSWLVQSVTQLNIKEDEV